MKVQGHWQYIDGTNNVSAIIAQLKQQFGDVAEIDNDVIDYMLVAQQQHWIDLVWQKVLAYLYGY